MQVFSQQAWREMRQSPRTEEDTRTKILQAALKLFARQGYDGTTTKDLAKSAGVAEGTLFRHFANKKSDFS